MVAFAIESKELSLDKGCGFDLLLLQSGLNWIRDPEQGYRLVVAINHFQSANHQYYLDFRWPNLVKLFLLMNFFH